MRTPTAFFASLTLLAPVLGQTTKVVIPAANAAKDGNALEVKPFGSDRVRLTQLLANSLVGVPKGKSITEIAYRRDKLAFPTATLIRRSSAAWSVRLGNLDLSKRGGGRGGLAGVAYDPSNPVGKYLNPGAGINDNTLRELYNATPVWPSLPPVRGAVAPFNIRFKLRAPFLYSGPDGLAIDHFAYSTRRGVFNYIIDAVTGQTDTGSVTDFGTPCPKESNRSYTIPTNPGGREFSMILFDGPPKSIGIGLIGSTKLAVNLAGLGLPACTLYASPDILLIVPTFSTGGARISVVVPADRAFAGLKVVTQWVLLDPRVNPQAPLGFSNGNAVTLGKTVGQGVPASFIYGYNANQTVRGPYGLVHKGIVLVTEITYR